MYKKFWIAKAGLRGYLPIWIEYFETKAEAIESALELHDDIEFGRPRVKGQLQKYHFAEIDLEKFGNEYIEIESVYESDPEVLAMLGLEGLL